MVLSSAYLANSLSITVKNVFKIIGPNLDPCGTPNDIFSHVL